MPTLPGLIDGQRALRSAVDEGLGLEPERPPRFSVRDLKAFEP